MPLPVKSDSVTEHLLLGSFEFRLSLPSWSLTRACFKLLLASLHGFQTAILGTLVLRGPPFVGATQLKQDHLPCGVSIRGFQSSLCIFPNKFDFYFWYFCFLWAPHCLLVLIFLLLLAVLYFFLSVIKKGLPKSFLKLISQGRSCRL